jgi:hypothetical protein
MTFVREPDHMKIDMDLYRHGLIPLPPVYIAYHRQCAKADLAKRDWNILVEDMASDGYMDGFKVVRVIVELPWDASENMEQPIMRLKWHESGAWFKAMPSGGWSRYCEALS